MPLLLGATVQGYRVDLHAETCFVHVCVSVCVCVVCASRTGCPPRFFRVLGTCECISRPIWPCSIGCLWYGAGYLSGAVWHAPAPARSVLHFSTVYWLSETEPTCERAKGTPGTLVLGGSWLEDPAQGTSQQSAGGRSLARSMISSRCETDKRRRVIMFFSRRGGIIVPKEIGQVQDLYDLGVTRRSTGCRGLRESELSPKVGVADARVSVSITCFFFFIHRAERVLVKVMFCAADGKGPPSMPALSATNSSISPSSISFLRRTCALPSARQ